MPGPPIAPVPPPSWGSLGRRLFLVTAACTLVHTLVACGQMWTSFSEAALVYDLRFDPVVIEKGELRVEGPRRPAPPDAPFTVDPDDALDLSTLPVPSVVLRKTELVDVQGGDPQRLPYTEILSLLDTASIRVDSASLSKFQAESGPSFLFAMGLTLGTFALGFDLFSLVPIIGLAGLLAARLSPGGPGNVRWWARRAAATAVLLPPLWLGANLLGLGQSPCFNVLVYPWLLSTVTLARARFRPSDGARPQD